MSDGVDWQRVSPRENCDVQRELDRRNDLPLLNCLTSAKSRSVTNSKCAGPGHGVLYSRAMDERLLNELPAWLTEAGLAGAPKLTLSLDSAIVASQLGFRLTAPTCLSTRSIQSTKGACFAGAILTNPRCTSTAAPASRGLMQRAPYLWMLRQPRSGRVAPSIGCWKRAPRCCAANSAPTPFDEFSLLPEWYAAGLTEYVAVLTRFAAEGVIGEMDALYSSWGTKAATGFDEDQIVALERIVPYLALAIKSVSLVRMTRTLMETYLGRDAGRRVLVAELCAALPSDLTLSFGSVICAASHGLRTPSPSRSSHC